MRSNMPIQGVNSRKNLAVNTAEFVRSLRDEHLQDGAPGVDLVDCDHTVVVGRLKDLAGSRVV